MKTILLFCFILLIGLFLFRESFSITFFQDDYFVLKISDADSLSGIFSFFIPRNDVQFYRPISHELWYFLLRKLFGLQPLAWHITGWMLWTTMIILVYRIGKKFLHRHTLQFLLPVLYGLSSIHYNTLFWSINTSYLMVSVFFFAALLVWWSAYTPGKKSLYLSGLFILGLLSNELMITLLPVLILDGLIRGRHSGKRSRWQSGERVQNPPAGGSFRPASPAGGSWTSQDDKDRLNIPNTSVLIPMIILSALYILLRIIYPPDIGSYPVELWAMPSSYRWFIFFFLNWPESIKDNMLSFWKIRPEFFEYFSTQIIIWFATSALIIFSVLLGFLLYVFRNKHYHKTKPSLIYVVSWFLLTILPIVAIPSHITPHHGSIALVGFLLLLLLPIDAAWKKISPVWRYASLYIILVLWLLSARTTVLFNNETYWIKRRSDIVKTWQAWTRNTYPNPPIGSEIVIPTDEKEVRVALNEGEAIRQIYADETLRVIFTHEPVPTES